MYIYDSNGNKQQVSENYTNTRENYDDNSKGCKTWVWIVLAILIVLFIVLVWWLKFSKNKSQNQFSFRFY